MGISEIILLAVSLSMDAFAVALCKGLALKKIDIKSCLTVGCWFGSFQGLMPLIGFLLGSTFADKITSVDHWIAFILLAIIGANNFGNILAQLIIYYQAVPILLTLDDEEYKIASEELSGLEGVK